MNFTQQINSSTSTSATGQPLQLNHPASSSQLTYLHSATVAYMLLTDPHHGFPNRTVKSAPFSHVTDRTDKDRLDYNHCYRLHQSNRSTFLLLLFLTTSSFATNSLEGEYCSNQHQQKPTCIGHAASHMNSVHTSFYIT